MDRIKNYLKCLSLCDSKFITVLSVVLNLVSVSAVLVLPLINSRIIDSFGASAIYTYIKYSLILFILKCLVDFFASVLRKETWSIPMPS